MHSLPCLIFFFISVVSFLSLPVLFQSFFICLHPCHYKISKPQSYRLNPSTLNSLNALVFSMIYSVCIVFYLFCFITSSPTFTFSQMVKSDSKPLTVGQELWKETIPLQMGARMYQLQGLKPQTWYEVKISYPASIPARFTIQLKKDNSDQLGMNQNRRLLNTEKLIFKTDGFNSDKIKLYVLVTVEPDGVVAILHVPERENIIFNIVCDELLVGIPHRARSVGILVLLCLGLAFIIPLFLPSWLLLKNRDTDTARQSFSKES